ncbi:Hypothetical protein SCF082_LOCUS11795 [Durusdinium trenchii]|uniref:HEAT repeat domain-containing protein n=1 Tax=Durusdinium trenchii TaxID=1381693 RepID=A0ABP0JFP5_9DINO
MAKLSFAPPLRALQRAVRTPEPSNALREVVEDTPWPNTKLESYLRSRGFEKTLHAGKWPQLEILVRQHEEEYGHTWYRLDCTIQYPGAETYVWYTSKRLRHFRERLHDRLKEELCPEDYEQLFASAPFARHGGLSGTTKRLSAWCGTLARSLSQEEFSQQLLVLVLCFIDTPCYIAGALPFCIDRSMERLAFRVEDGGWFVRFSAAQAIPQVADTGDFRAIATLIELLGDQDAHVRGAAAESLAEVTFKGDRSVQKTLGTCLEDCDPQLREAAAQAMAMVAERGDEFACGLLLGHLEDPDHKVKKAVKESLKLLGRADSRSLRAAGHAER